MHNYEEVKSLLTSTYIIITTTVSNTFNDVQHKIQVLFRLIFVTVSLINCIHQLSTDLIKVIGNCQLIAYSIKQMTNNFNKLNKS